MYRIFSFIFYNISNSEKKIGIVIVTNSSSVTSLNVTALKRSDDEVRRWVFINVDILSRYRHCPFQSHKTCLLKFTTVKTLQPLIYMCTSLRQNTSTYINLRMLWVPIHRGCCLKLFEDYRIIYSAFSKFSIAKYHQPFKFNIMDIYIFLILFHECMDKNLRYLIM